jgi:hypothetical protein
MRHRRQARAGELARPRRAAWPVLAALAAALAVMIALAGSGRGQAPSATPSASPAATPVASPGAVSRTPTTQMIVAGHATVAITDDAMTPAHFESAVGRHVQLTVVNAGSRTHNFTMAAFAIDIDLAPGDAVTFDLGVPDLGDYPYFSDLPGDEDLKGTMTVFI